MRPETIEAAAQKILTSLTGEQLDYVRSESTRRINSSEEASTPFSCLHDLIDANELLPEDSIDWEAPDGPDFTQSNAIMEAFNRLILRQG